MTKIGGHVSICSDLQGYVYLVSSCNNVDIVKSDNDIARSTHTSDFDPSCETFKVIQKSKNSWKNNQDKLNVHNAQSNQSNSTAEVVSGAMVIVIENETKIDEYLEDRNTPILLRFGGWKFLTFNAKSNPYRPKECFSYVYCSYELQDYHESTDRFNVLSKKGSSFDGNNFKSGHSRIVTELASLDEMPTFNSTWDMYDIQRKTWLGQNEQQQDKLYLVQSSCIPFCTGDSATVQVGQTLYVIGGYKIECDKSAERQGLLYQV